MLGRIARAPDSDVRRRLTFCPGSLRPATDRFVRRVGRPRNEWAPKLLQLAVQKWGTLNTVERLMHNEMIWKAEVARHFWWLVRGSIHSIYIVQSTRLGRMTLDDDGSRNGVLTKFIDDSASFLLEKLKNHVILIKNPNILTKNPKNTTNIFKNT